MENEKFYYAIGTDYTKPFLVSMYSISVDLEDHLKISEEQYKDITSKAIANSAVMIKVKEDGTFSFVLTSHTPLAWETWDYTKGEWVISEENKVNYEIALYESEVATSILWASDEIEQLQDMVDYDEANEEQIQHLDLAKKYRVALNKIKRAVGYPNLEIKLPERPY